MKKISYIIAFLLSISLTTTAFAGTATHSISYTVTANQAPTATCSAAQAITLPTSVATVSGDGSDPDGTIVSSSWAFSSGPSTPTVVTPNSSSLPHTTDITGLTSVGIYRFTHQVIDNQGATGICTTDIYVDPAPENPDLIAGASSPSSATVGTSLIFQALITNQGSATTGLGFNNRYQVANAANGGGTITNLSPVSLGALGAGSSNTVFSPSYTFNSQGTHSVRVCADIPPLPDGNVPESDEGNNCGAWTNVTVSAAGGKVSVDLSADPLTINFGNASLLQWSSSNATSCAGSNFSTSGQLNGNVWVSPPVTTTYTITCTNATSSEQDQVEVVVVGGPTYQCSDTEDNDKDGFIDYPDDPGCLSIYDDDETDVAGAYQCSDGLDNDGDTKIDDADPGCHTDNDENNPASYDPNDNDERDKRKPIFIEF